MDRVRWLGRVRYRDAHAVMSAMWEHGADAARFVTEIKDIVETHDWQAEIGY